MTRHSGWFYSLRGNWYGPFDSRDTAERERGIKCLKIGHHYPGYQLNGTVDVEDKKLKDVVNIIEYRSI